VSRTTTQDRPRVEITPMLRSMLEQTPAGALVAPSRGTLEVRRTERLDRRAQATVDDARRTAGVTLEYLGIQPLFTQPRLYAAEPHDWILAPASRAEDLVVPRREQAVLRRLTAADVDFQLIYTAHEVPKEKTREIVAGADPHTDLEPAQAAEIIGPVPEPHESVRLGSRLEQRTGQVLRGVRRTALAGGALVAGLAAAPVVLAGAALAGLAQLDPIILGAMPMDEPRDGRPAAWFVLARWDW
jgi:hypothetical protein